MKFPKWVLDEVTPKKEGYLRRTLIRDLEDTGIPGLTLELVDNFSSSEIDNFKKPQELPAALKYASEYLYSPETNLEPPDLDDSLFIYQAPSAYMEMESAGRLIKAQILKGTEPHHLGVVVPNIPRYLPIIEDVGRRFGIRFYLQRGFPLEQSEPVLAILDLLSLFGSNWELKRVIRLLSSPYYNFGLATLPLEGLLNSKIIDDRAGCGFTDILSKDSINSDLQPVLEIVEKLKDKERDLLKTNDWKTFLEIFNETLEEFRWGKEIIASEIPPQTNHLNYTRVNDEYAKKSKHDSLGVEEFWKVFLELKNALIDSINSPKCNLLEFKIWLNKAINQRYVKISDPSSFSSYVQVLHYYNIHGAFFEGLFLLGLNEKVFPKGRGEGNYWPKEFKDGFTKKFVKRPIWTNSTERYFE
ncbi:MAG: hypothetical protein LBF22_13245 [Deltaproteobacteria bacterium]|nr:hypothetical protein [Deltaproteobacteria bacterium]